MRHAVVNQNGKVVNVIEWNGAAWLPPKDHYVVYAPISDIGDTYDLDQEVLMRADRRAKDPNPDLIEAENTLKSLQDKLNELKRKLS